MKFKINITQEVIASAIQRDPQNCAFAKAYNELVPNVRVNYSFISFYDDEDRNMITQIPLRESHKTFIQAFDKGQAVPREFEVDIPQTVINYWFQSFVDVAQKIADSKIMKLLD